MRRPVKIALWVLVFVACATAGAVVASNVDPFPPGVEDPGARPSASGSTTPSPPSETTVVRLVVDADTRHELYVGGSCTSDWVLRVDVVVDADGAATGTGEGRLRPGAACSFDTAQLQARGVTLAAQGHVQEGTLLLAIREDGDRTPTGAVDLGGLVETLPRLRLAVPIDGPRDVVDVERPDGELGRYVARYRASARCREGCGA